MKKLILLTGFVFLSLLGCHSENKVLKVAATPVPHAEILENIKSELASDGIELKIVEVDDYNLPNRLLYEKQVDANFFQHKPFLDEQNLRFNYKLQELTAVHIEPLGIYSQKVKALSDLRDRAIISIPNDPTNESRALLLLVEVGLIKLRPNLNMSQVTIQDIVENRKNIKIEEIDAAFLPRSLDDVDAAVIPANFALQSNLNPTKDALALEGADSPYSNIIAIRSEDADREDLQYLKKALTSEKMRKFIKEKYHGAITPAF